MFVPLHDENVLKSIRFQYVTIGLIVANLVVFLFEALGLQEAVIASFAIIPTELVSPAGMLELGDVPDQTVAVPERLTLISYMFFHGDILHLAGNMLFLWVFGDNVEDAMGHLKFLIFYLACGIFAGLAHAYMMPELAQSADWSQRGRGGCDRGLPDAASEGAGLGAGLSVHSAPALGGGGIGRVGRHAVRDDPSAGNRPCRVVGTHWGIVGGGGAHHCHEATRRSALR